MRTNWTNPDSLVPLTREQIESLVQRPFPGSSVAEFEYARGGLANTNICVSLTGRKQPVLLRLFVRDPQQGRKEAALDRLLDGRVQTPRVLFFSATNDVTGHPFLVREWSSGTRLETHVQALSPEAARELGSAVGVVLADIHAITFSQSGFFDAECAVAQPVQLGSAGMLTYARDCLLVRNGAERLGTELTEEVLQFMHREAPLLDTWKGAPCLTHADFGGSNILVEQHSLENNVQQWCVSAVIDWEFAFSGTPFFDFGNLLRQPLGSIEPFVKEFERSYTDSGGTLPDAWRRMSLLTDLTAWFDFLSRPNCSQPLIDDARHVVRDTINAFSS